MSLPPVMDDDITAKFKPEAEAQLENSFYGLVWRPLDWARDQLGSAFAKLVDLRRVLTKPSRTTSDLLSCSYSYASVARLRNDAMGQIEISEGREAPMRTWTVTGSQILRSVARTQQFCRRACAKITV